MYVHTNCTLFYIFVFHLTFSNAFTALCFGTLPVDFSKLHAVRIITVGGHQMNNISPLGVRQMRGARCLLFRTRMQIVDPFVPMVWSKLHCLGCMHFLALYVLMSVERNVCKSRKSDDRKFCFVLIFHCVD
jgi:hypothetical protein